MRVTMIEKHAQVKMKAFTSIRCTYSEHTIHGPHCRRVFTFGSDVGIVNIRQKVTDSCVVRFYWTKIQLLPVILLGRNSHTGNVTGDATHVLIFFIGAANHIIFTRTLDAITALLPPNKILGGN